MFLPERKGWWVLISSPHHDIQTHLKIALHIPNAHIYYLLANKIKHKNKTNKNGSRFTWRRLTSVQLHTCWWSLQEQMNTEEVYEGCYHRKQDERKSRVFSKWQAILDTYNRIKCKGPLLYAGIVFLGNSMINRRFQEHFAFTHKPKLDFSFR